MRFCDIFLSFPKRTCVLAVAVLGAVSINLMTLLAVAGITFIIGVPGADDIMLNYQSTSFHDALYLRNVLGLRAAPEYEQWLKKMNIMDSGGAIRPVEPAHPLLARMPKALAA